MKTIELQGLPKKGRFISEWGAFLIVIDSRLTRCMAEVRRRDSAAVVAVMPELPSRSSREAIEWVAQQLEELGACAFVDGQRRSLANFLEFVEQSATGR